MGRALLQEQRWGVLGKCNLVKQITSMDKTKMENGFRPQKWGASAVPSQRCMVTFDTRTNPTYEQFKVERVQEREAMGEATRRRGQYREKT